MFNAKISANQAVLKKKLLKLQQVDSLIERSLLEKQKLQEEIGKLKRRIAKTEAEKKEEQEKQKRKQQKLHDLEKELLQRKERQNKL